MDPLPSSITISPVPVPFPTSTARLSPRPSASNGGIGGDTSRATGAQYYFDYSTATNPYSTPRRDPHTGIFMTRKRKTLSPLMTGGRLTPTKFPRTTTTATTSHDHRSSSADSNHHHRSISADSTSSNTFAFASRAPAAAAAAAHNRQRSNSTDSNSSSSNERFESVLDHPLLLFPYWQQIDNVFGALFPEWTGYQRGRMVHHLVHFLELKVGLDEYNTQKGGGGLLLPSPIVDQAWRALVLETSLYKQVTRAIQDFHGKLLTNPTTSGGGGIGSNNKKSKMIHYTIFGKTQDAPDKLRRTQSLFQVYFLDTMPMTITCIEKEEQVQQQQQQQVLVQHQIRAQAQAQQAPLPVLSFIQELKEWRRMDPLNNSNSNNNNSGPSRTTTIPMLQQPILPTSNSGTTPTSTDENDCSGSGHCHVNKTSGHRHHHQLPPHPNRNRNHFGGGAAAAMKQNPHPYYNPTGISISININNIDSATNTNTNTEQDTDDTASTTSMTSNGSTLYGLGLLD